jgi:hypothetical protein
LWCRLWFGLRPFFGAVAQLLDGVASDAGGTGQ